jgi:cysteinyl-tRNA synthetase
MTAIVLLWPIFYHPNTYIPHIFIDTISSMRLYNTLTHQREILEPPHDGIVKIYCCGPTVYDFTHIGHLRKYTFDDVLVRTLKFFGHSVRHVINITDVGHLTDDGDNGTDKLEMGAIKTKKTVWEVADSYTKFFLDSLDAVGINRPDVLCKATDHIDEMITMIRALEANGYAYQTSEAVYFDTSKFAEYGALTGQKLSDKKNAVRDSVHTDLSKRHQADFALWFRKVGRFSDHAMSWESPWGVGFPGWHIECSAMSTKYLGDKIDIHTGGVDHIPVHHTNEIAQSECATGKKPFSRFWVHHNFLNVENQKMSKSLGNFLTIFDLKEKGYEPYSLKFLFLGTHYRSQMNFTWRGLDASQKRLKTLIKSYSSYQADGGDIDDKIVMLYRDKFAAALEDDLNTPSAIALFGSIIDDKNANNQTKKEIFDLLGSTLGIPFGRLAKNLESSSGASIPPNEVINILNERNVAKSQKDYQKSDHLREKLATMGYLVEDIKNGESKLIKINR